MNQSSYNPENPQSQGNALPSYGEQYGQPGSMQQVAPGSVPSPAYTSYPSSDPYASPPNPYAVYPGMSPGVMSPPEKGRGMAVAGLVLGILGMIVWLLPFLGLPVSIVGIVLAVQGRRCVSRRTMATIGLVLSIIALVLTLINGVLGAYLAVQHMNGY